MPSISPENEHKQNAGGSLRARQKLNAEKPANLIISAAAVYLTAAVGKPAAASCDHSGQLLQRCPRSRSQGWEARMSSHDPEPPQVPTNITCPKCKAIGVVVWEMAGAERCLVSLTRNFHERISKIDPFPIELVCHGCGTTQPED
jgi:hypothetical protein